MKKIFALALAAVMTAGMTTVAFAAEDPVLTIGNHIFKESDGVGEWVGDLDSTSFNNVLEPGETYYISINADGMDLADINGNKAEVEKKADDVTKSIANKYKIYDDWKIGEIKDMEISYKKIELFDGSWEDSKSTGYRYVVAFEIPELESAKSYDVAGEIKIAKSSTKAKDLTGMRLDATVGKFVTIEDDTIDATDLSLVKFSKDAELTDVEITWGSDEVAMFEVNVSGQGKLNLAYNTDFNKEFADKYDYANIDFVTFEGTPSFNRTGKLYIYADADTYLYEVTEDGAKAVKAEYDEDYEAWVLNTRTLKAYAISDVELDEQTVTEDKTDDESSKTDDGVKENPDTGR